MKLLADAVATSRDEWGQRVDVVRNALRRSNHNHFALTYGAREGVERFVFAESEMDGIGSDFNSLDEESQDAVLQAARVPFLRCWVEFAEGPMRFGAFAEVSSGSLTLEAFSVFKSGSGLLYLGRLISAYPIPVDGQVDISSLNPETLWLGNFLEAIWVRVVLSFAAISSSRVTSVRKVNYSQETKADRERAKRRMQRGLPLNSYNVVTLKCPATAIHRGEVGESSGRGIRGHMVIGHWRLIDGQLEAYWTWVDGHERGDPGLGWIVKERHFKQAGGARSGFAVPSFAGVKGQRVRASCDQGVAR